MTTNSRPKVFIFDLETTGFDANRGHILCATGKWWGEDWHYEWAITDDENHGTCPDMWEYDRDIAVEIRDLCEEARAVVAYYGGYGKFDVPYLNTRLMRWGETPCRQLSIVDPFQAAKGKLKMARNSMGAVAALLGCDEEKTHLPWGDWHAAKFGDKDAMTNLLEYCANDVYVLEEMYGKMLPLFPAHPHTANRNTLSESDPCRVCGGPTYSKGWRYLSKTRVHDVVCKNTACGWRGDGRRETIKS